MNYFTRGMFSDPQFWVKIIVVPAIGGLVVIDFLSYMFAAPGFLNLWAVKIVGIFSIVGVIVYGIYLYKKPKSDKNTEEDQAYIETLNEDKFRKMILDDPEFQTFCYQCVHFNQRFGSCGKKIFSERSKRARLNEKYTYCLHWLPLEEQEETNQI